jgi:predicted transcriptional regulator
MSGRNSFEIKKAILEALKEGKSHTFAELERKVGSNWKSIRGHCKELEIFNCITIEKKKSHKRNNKPYYELAITEKGLKALEQMQKTNL